MLVAVAAEAERRGLRKIETVQASAEGLPFRDGHFDFLASRYSAHHWRDARAGLREARRVLRPGATAFFIDIVAPEAAAFDTHFQAVELLRDVSHVRDYGVAEWRESLASAGFSTSSRSCGACGWIFPSGRAGSVRHRRLRRRSACCSKRRTT
jgi:ubiquinone/menaquinone biosynthesis C-methylase UbiE